MKCNYCGTNINSDTDNCNKCGAPNEIAKRNKEIADHGYFYHEGYIVWCMREMSSDVYSYTFYRGQEAVARLRFSRAYLSAKFPDPGVESFDYIWGLFKLQQGLTDAVIEKGKPPAEPTFVTIRVESKEKAWAKSLDNDSVERLISSGRALVYEM